MRRDEMQEVVNKIFSTRRKAINDKDLALYMSTISGREALYVNEQRRWFEDLIRGEVTDIVLDIDQVTEKADGAIRVDVHQTHHCVKDFDIKYPLRLEKENGEFKDVGCDFKVIDHDSYSIKYLDDVDNADRFDHVLEHAIERVEEIFHRKLPNHVVLKLFGDKEILRQRVLTTFKWNFLAWGEPDEALKFYAKLDNFSQCQGMLQHEVVHMMAIPIPKHHVPSWVNEGIAMWYGNADYNFEDDFVLSDKIKCNYRLKLDELENFDLYNATDMELIRGFYVASCFYVGYLIETYGHDKFITLMESWDGDGREAFNVIYQLDKDDLFDGYIEWIEGKGY